MASAFLERLRRRDVLVGSLCGFTGGESAEIFARLGFDWLFIDAEHAPLDVLTVQRLIQAAGGRCATLVRVPGNDPTWIQRMLDLGCDGVIVPQVGDVSAAQRATRACHHAPVGTRGLGVARAQGYGLDLTGYPARADGAVACVLQIEHVAALGELDGILATPHLSAIFVGPYDLSASLGMPGQIDHPTVEKAIEEVRVACERRNVPIGIFVGDPVTAKRRISTGFRLVAVATDGLLLGRAARELLTSVRG
jgi:2-keto-3-deoxy-L-rhamnonate aldolase RhmA